VPRSPSLRTKLLFDREEELELLVEALGSDTDSGRSRILCVTGSSWVGKSHLVLLALDSIGCSGEGDETGNIEVVRVRADNRKSAARVLEGMLHELRNGFNAIVDKRNRAEEELPDVYQWAMKYLAGLEPLLGGGASQITMKQLQGWSTTIKGLLDVGIKVPVFSLGGSLSETSAEREEEAAEVVIPRPDPDGIGDLIVFLCDLYVEAGFADSVLLFVDDLDLISHERNDSEQLDTLVDVLRSVAEAPSTIVLVTGRKYYMNLNQDVFFQVMDVPPIEELEFSELYLKHLRAFSPQGQDAGLDDGPFDSEVLAEVARRAKGIVGAFLRDLHAVHEHFRKQIRFQEIRIGPDELETYHRDMMKWFEKEYPDQMKLIRGTFGEGQLMLQHDDPDFFQMTELFYSVLRPALTQEGRYEINPTWEPYLR